MSRISIISKDGLSVRYSGEPTYTGEYLNTGVLEFGSISSPYPISWEVGDYVDYHRTGLRYKLYSIPEPTKQARKGEYGGAFVYDNVRFYDATRELYISPFRDLVPNDNRIHFSTRPDVSTYEDVYGIARRIQACMDEMYPGSWVISVLQTENESLASQFLETKEFSLSNGNCLDALSSIFDLWKGIGWTYSVNGSGKNQIIIGGANERTEANTTKSFAYGKGKGLKSIKKGVANEEEFATRLYVYGSERNLPARYYNQQPIKDAESVDIVNLMIPISEWGKSEGLPDARKAYIEADASIIEKYGLIPRSVYFNGGENEDIYPSIVGLTESMVRSAMIDAGDSSSSYLPDDTDIRIDKVLDVMFTDDLGGREDIKANPDFEMWLAGIGFDLVEQGKLTSEGRAVISMKSGACAGRDFVVKRNRFVKANQELVIERVWDETLQMGFPNRYYPIERGDEFVLLDIPMPDYYVTLAQERLLEAGRKMLADYTRVSAFYEPSIDSIVVNENGILLREGTYMQVYDEDIVDTDNNVDYVLINGITIDESGPLPTYSIQLSEQKRAAGGFSALEDMVEDVRGESKEDAKRIKKYTDRRFASLQESLSMLQEAFDGFSAGIDPVTVQTMTLVAGDQRSQFRFTKSRQSLDPVPCPIYYDSATRMMMADAAALVHFTLGIDSLTAPNVRVAGDYMSWNLKAGHSAALDDGSKSYYVCVKAQKQGIDAELYLTETPVALEDDEFYYLYVGILNSESGGSRDFATIYGFTEVAPGRIVTNVIRSADGTCVFDLENNTITGPMKFLPGTSGIENIEGIAEVIENSVGDLEFGKYNLIRNSGFTGDFVTESLGGSEILDENKQLFSDPLRHWTSSNAMVQDSEVSESGKECVLTAGLLIQTIQNRLISGEKYVFSFRAKGESLTYSVGGVQKTITLTDKWTRYVEKFTAVSPSQEFAIHGATCVICEVQLERGTVVSAWGQNIKDNQSELAKYQSLDYLQQAIKNGNTDIMGGLILSNLIMLGNPGKSDNTAGISGIRNDDNDVAFWGGGTFSQAIATVMKYLEDPTYQPTDAEVANMAKFVITHGGRAILNDIILRGIMYAKGGKIGNLEITENGLTIDTHLDGSMRLDEWGLSLVNEILAKGSLGSAKVGNCGMSVIEAVIGHDGYICFNTDDGKEAAIFAKAIGNTHAFYCPSGQFAGLRTKTRVVTSDTHLRVSDYNVLVNKTSGKVTLTMPDVSTYEWPVDPAEIDGQEIIVETRGADITLVSNGANMYSHKDNNSTLQSELNVTARGVFRMKYYHEAGMWTFAWIDRYTD